MKQVGRKLPACFLEREMFMKKIISLVMACVFTFALSVTAFAETYTNGYFQYTVEDSSVTITKYFGTEETVTVPNMIAGNPVNTIAAGAFDGNDAVKSVTLPDTITEVQPGAFAAAQSVNYAVPQTGTPVVTTAPVITTESVAVKTSGGYSPVYTGATGGDYRPADTTQSSANNIADVPVQTTDIEKTVAAVLPDEPDIQDIEYIIVEDGVEAIEISDGSAETTTAQVTTTEKPAPAVTTAVTTIVTTAENIVSVSINDAGQLVGIDERGAETVLEPEKTYATEQQPDGSIKIVDEDGEELVIAVGDIQIAETTQETTAETASAGTAATSPSQQTASSDNGIVIVIIAIVAAVVVIAVVIVIVLMKKRR